MTLIQNVFDSGMILPLSFSCSSAWIGIICFQLALDIAGQTEENLALIKITGIIEQIFGEVDSNDVLLRMNIVELLSKFGITKHGLAFLEENKIIFKLFAVIEDDNDPVSCQLCEPGKTIYVFFLLYS